MLLSIVRVYSLTYTSVSKKLEKSLFLIMFLSHQTWKSTSLPCKLMRKSILHQWRKHCKRYSDHCAIKFCMTMKAFEQKQASEKLRSGTSMILRVGKSLVNLQNPQLFSVVCGKLVTILKLVTKNRRTI